MIKTSDNIMLRADLVSSKPKLLGEPGRFSRTKLAWFPVFGKLRFLYFCEIPYYCILGINK